MVILDIKNLGKAYRSYHYQFQRFASWFGVPVRPREETWVLRNINLDVHYGDSIGIIGQNGAGKSTLLKLITGTQQPTEGTVQCNGRISAVLELGMGFNHELSGRQNASHALGLNGFSSRQIQQLMAAVEDFAEIGEYFDEPMRTYSSGMQMRIAFAVAVAYRPEILIVDEALSVGDTYFQHKSFSRIREFQQHNTTLLFVSHDRTAVQSLCNKAVLLEKGQLVKHGNSEEVFDYYNAIIADREHSTVTLKKLDSGKVQTTSGTGEARLEEIALYNYKGEVVETVGVGDPVELHVKVKVYKSLETLILGYAIKDRLGQVMYGNNTWHTKQCINHLMVGSEYRFVIAFPANFGVGSYSIAIALHDKDTHMSKNYEWSDLALVFNVVNTDKTQFFGCTWIEPKVTVTTL
ncbi:MAG: ABC transporter ATP-binding protein [Nitrospirae bacterium]|nr:ABC transporter ATP-binding protein [Nitrospirota bacterium]